MLLVLNNQALFRTGSYCCYPDVGMDVTRSSFYVKVSFYVMVKALSVEISYSRTGLVRHESCFGDICKLP